MGPKINFKMIILICTNYESHTCRYYESSMPNELSHVHVWTALALHGIRRRVGGARSVLGRERSRIEA